MLESTSILFIMKKILVTGGAGYIGSITVKELNKKGFDVVVYDNLSSGHKKHVLKPAQLVIGDLLDVKSLGLVFKKYKPDAVIHFAASIEAGESAKNPGKFFQNNVVCSLNLLNVMAESGTKKIVYSSSAAVYGEPKKVPIEEHHDIKPVNCYGSTKMMVEEMLRHFEKSHDIKHVSLRYFNASGADLSGKLGEKHNPETHLIPLAIETALGKRPYCFIYGTDYKTPDGTCLRDYIHVNDLAEAHILALNFLKKNNSSEVFNLGIEKGNSVLEVIEKIKKITGKNFKVKISKRRSGDPAKLVASSKKARQKLKWKPKYSNLDIIIKTAYNWHKKNKK